MNYEDHTLDYEDRDRLLQDYCDALLTNVRARGARVITPDFPLERIFSKQSLEKFADHFNGFKNGPSVFVANSDESGHADVFAVQNRPGLLDRTCKFYGLNAEKLHTEGVTDTLIYARKVIHEHTHLYGYDDAPTKNEAHVYALTRVRLADAGGLSLNDKALDFCDNLDLMHNALSTVLGRTGDYGAVPEAVDFVKKSAGTSLADYSISDKFRIAVTKIGGGANFDRHSDPVMLKNPEFKANIKHSFEFEDIGWEASRRIKEFLPDLGPADIEGRSPVRNMAIRDAAFTAAEKAKIEAAQGENLTSSERNSVRDEAKFLEHLATTIDQVAQYSDNYYPTRACATPRSAKIGTPQPA